MTRESAMERTALTFEASGSAGEVSALSLRPSDTWVALVLAHGAGAGMHHPFMSALAERLGARGIATFRYQFPYMEAGSRRPDPAPLLMKTVRIAVAAARDHFDGIPLLAGGKSMGGRMTSSACAVEPLSGVHGLVFYGFPLHPAGRPATARAEHLSAVSLPTLFLQGTRDALADLDLLRPVCAALGPAATLHISEGADHGFHVLKRSGRTDAEVLDELADVTRDWARERIP